MHRVVDPRRFSADESHATKKDKRNKKTVAPEVESTEASFLDQPASPSYQTHEELPKVAIVETKGNGTNNDDMSDTELNVNQQPESTDPTEPTSTNNDEVEKPTMSQTNDDADAHNNTEPNDVTAKKSVDNNELLPTESLVAPVSIKLNRPISLNPKSPERSPPRSSRVLDMPHGSPVRSLVSRFEKKEVKSLDALPFRTVRGFFSDERSIHVSTEKEKYDALVEKQRQEALLRSPMGGKRTPRSHRFPPPAFCLDDDEEDQRSEADVLDANQDDLIISEDPPESSQVDVVANDNEVASVDDVIQQLDAEIVEPAVKDIPREKDESHTVEEETLESFDDSNQQQDETGDEEIASMAQQDDGVRDEEIANIPEAEEMNDVHPPPPSEEPQEEEHDRSQIIETPEHEVKKRPILTTERSFVMEDDHTIETEDMIVVGERLSSSGAEDDFFARDYTMEQLEQDFQTVPIQDEAVNDCKSPAKRTPKKSAIKKPEVRSKLFVPTTASLASRTTKNPQSVKKEKSQPVKPLYVPSPAATPTKNRYANVQSKVKGMIEAPVSVRKGSTSSDSNISVSSPTSSTRSAHTPVRPRRTPTGGSASVDRRSFEKTSKLNRQSLGSIRSDDAHSDGGDFDDNGGSSPSNRPLKSGAVLTSRKVRYDDVQPRYLDYTKKSAVYMRNQEEQLERRRRLEEASALRSAERQNQLRAKDKSRFDYNEEINPRRQTHIGTPSRQIAGQARVARARASSSSAAVSIATESDESAPVA
ncbi:hypothetical protein Poli38472_008033 [Pythium oligandrum]|uniref:Uncharacterized protein n=1 Tax=Pythium oligandrum TaxID=41045 RepID=A0A8K1CKP7_PYTOL|nr:hypothetical protein Poli38472_008033 [Pythium oligandrum]|eukprot:TMW65391.1 hypothetical protein Poli38472_008033 [Pythium oligandrum]